MAMTRHGEEITLFEINEPTDIITESAWYHIIPMSIWEGKRKIAPYFVSYS